jgi:hypothetical protein
MSDPAVSQAFLQGEIEAMEPFGAVMTGPAGSPFNAVEVTRLENGSLEVRVPGRPPIFPPLSAAVQAGLREHGFACEDPSDHTHPWAKGVADAAEATALVWRLLTEVFQAKPDLALDVAHGSHKAEHEARQKIADLRKRIEKPLIEIAGGPVSQDADGDYVLAVHDVHVTVAPRVLPGGRLIIRVFAVCTMGVTVTGELGLFLARLNFGLMFGRFALDAEHRSIWFDETLLGDQANDDLLKFTVDVVATTADEWDDRLKQMFGGATPQDILKSQQSPSDEPLPAKPGEGGYI